MCVSSPYGWGQALYGWGHAPYGWGKAPYGWGHAPSGWGKAPYGLGHAPYGWGKALYGWGTVGVRPPTVGVRLGSGPLHPHIKIVLPPGTGLNVSVLAYEVEHAVYVPHSAMLGTNSMKQLRQNSHR